MIYTQHYLDGAAQLSPPTRLYNDYFSSKTDCPLLIPADTLMGIQLNFIEDRSIPLNFDSAIDTHKGFDSYVCCNKNIPLINSEREDIMG